MGYDQEKQSGSKRRYPKAWDYPNVGGTVRKENRGPTNNGTMGYDQEKQSGSKRRYPKAWDYPTVGGTVDPMLPAEAARARACGWALVSRKRSTCDAEIPSYRAPRSRQRIEGKIREGPLNCTKESPRGDKNPLLFVLFKLVGLCHSRYCTCRASLIDLRVRVATTALGRNALSWANRPGQEEKD